MKNTITNRVSLIAGNRVACAHLLADPQQNFLLIIKNGSIYKNIAPKP